MYYGEWDVWAYCCVSLFREVALLFLLSKCVCLVRPSSLCIIILVLVKTPSPVSVRISAWIFSVTWSCNLLGIVILIIYLLVISVNFIFNLLKTNLKWWLLIWCSKQNCTSCWPVYVIASQIIRECGIIV